MSTVNLMILGELMGKPMNAYEMKKKMEYKNLEYWVKISTPSIYKNLIKLHEKGYLEAEVVREGEMPEKTVYTINDKGRQYFFSLMKKYSHTPGYVYIDFLACIANLHYMDAETGSKVIADMKEQLALVRDRLQQQMDAKYDAVPYHAKALISLYADMYALFSDWAERFEKEYLENGGG